MQASSLRRALHPRRPGAAQLFPFPVANRPHAFSASAAAAHSPKDARNAPPPIMPKRPWGEALAAAQHAFCLPLAGRVLAASATGNAVVAPVAVHASLALAAAGARGDTRRQVLQVLGGGGGGRSPAADAASVAWRVVKRVLKDRSTSGGPRLAFTGGIWAHTSTNLLPGFVEAARNVYSSTARTADFINKPEDSAKQINMWVKESTKGTVTSLLPDGLIDQNTGLVIGSALYFRGRWLDRADIRSTAVQKFCCLDGTCVDVPFVEYDRTRPFAVHDGFKVIKLPYQQGKNERKFSMYIFLPDAHDGLFELTKKIFAEPSFLDQHLPTEKRHVDIRVPKFTVSFQVDMKEFLTEMGLELPFLREADFADMVKEDESRSPLYISDILHKAILEVNDMVKEDESRSPLHISDILHKAILDMVKEDESRSPLHISDILYKAIFEVNDKGIDETSVTMGIGKPSPGEHFVADHPFFFVIKEEVSGSVIFMGHILDPSSQS